MLVLTWLLRISYMFPSSSASSLPSFHPSLSLSRTTPTQCRVICYVTRSSIRLFACSSVRLLVCPFVLPFIRLSVCFVSFLPFLILSLFFPNLPHLLSPCSQSTSLPIYAPPPSVPSPVSPPYSHPSLRSPHPSPSRLPCLPLLAVTAPERSSRCTRCCRTSSRVTWYRCWWTPPPTTCWSLGPRSWSMWWGLVTATSSPRPSSCTC